MIQPIIIGIDSIHGVLVTKVELRRNELSGNIGLVKETPEKW
jgi:hypothetical protein